MNFEILYTFIIATSALAVAPGPDNIYVMLQSITHGKMYSMATILGLISGCLIHTTLVAFGVSVIIQQSDTLFFLLKLCGALYLFYLAFKVYQSSSSISFEKETILKKSYLQLFKQGFVMNVLNPKVSIFFLAFFPGFLFSKTYSPVVQFYVLGVLFMIVSFIIFSLIAIMAGSVSDMVRNRKGFGVFLKWLQIIVFVGIGIFILFSEK